VTNIGAGKIGAAGSKTIKPQTEWRPGVQWRYAGLQNSKMIGHDYFASGCGQFSKRYAKRGSAVRAGGHGKCV